MFKMTFTLLKQNFGRCIIGKIMLKIYMSQSLRLHVVSWLCFTSHKQQGHLETAIPFTVPCEIHEA